MTNQSLRERFQLPDNRAETATRIIADAVEAGLVKGGDPRRGRYRRYRGSRTATSMKPSEL
jgi:ATP-dependent DNA helicase RecG